MRGPYRVIEVGFQRNADDFFHLIVSRAQDELVAIAGALSSLVEHIDPLDDNLDDHRFLDRVMRAATGGVASGAQIALAFEMDALASSADLDAWEAELTCSAEDAALATAIVATLHGAGDADSIQLPTYGVARREKLPRLTRARHRSRGVEGWGIRPG